MRRTDAMSPLPPTTALGDAKFSPVVARAYGRALDALASREVPFLLGGALALHAHTGIWRDTKDLDVFVRPDDAERALDALARAGFDPEIVYESWLGKAWSDDVFVDVIWRNANALFPVEDDWLARGRPMRLLGRDVRALGVEELLVTKMLVGGRNRFDGADMLHLLHRRLEDVDWERLAILCGEHVGVMLAFLHLYRWAYPGWRDRVDARVLEDYAARADEAGSGYGPFRGRLLDIQSFAVDVDDWGMPDPHRRALEDVFGDAEGRA